METQREQPEPAPAQCPRCQEASEAGMVCTACLVSELFRRLRDGR